MSDLSPETVQALIARAKMVVLCLDTESDLATEAGAAKRAAEAALSAATVAAQQIRERLGKLDPHSTREIVSDHLHSKKLGHNPSWLKVVDVLALLPPEGQP